MYYDYHYQIATIIIIIIIIMIIINITLAPSRPLAPPSGLAGCACKRVEV